MNITVSEFENKVEKRLLKLTDQNLILLNWFLFLVPAAKAKFKVSLFAFRL